MRMDKVRIITIVLAALMFTSEMSWAKEYTFEDVPEKSPPAASSKTLENTARPCSKKYQDRL